MSRPNAQAAGGDGITNMNARTLLITFGDVVGTWAAPAVAHADPQLDAAICQYFDNHGGVNGGNLRDVSQRLHDSGMSVDQYNAALVSAVKNSCPQYRSAFLEWAQHPW